MVDSESSRLPRSTVGIIMSANFHPAVVSLDCVATEVHSRCAEPATVVMFEARIPTVKSASDCAGKPSNLGA